MATKLDINSNNRIDWLAARTKYIGSSEVATICDLNRFDTPLQLWARKTGKLPAIPENDNMWMGRELEPIVAKFFTRRTGLEVIQDGSLWVNDKFPLACATPDYEIPVRNEILEIKTSSIRAEPFWSEDKPPTSAHIQVIWQLGVTEKQGAFVAGLLGSDPDKFYTPHVEFDESIFSQLYERVDAFIQMVQKDIPPDAKGSDLRTLNEIIKRVESTTIEFENDDADLLSNYFELEKRIKAARSELSLTETELDDLRAKITQKMGTASIAKGNGYMAKIKTINRAAYEVKASSYSRFSISEAKD